MSDHVLSAANIERNLPRYRIGADFGEAAGLLYLAMHYVEGSDLWQVLGRHGPLQPAQAARIFSQVAGALDAAHRQGLIRRDVKPGNVLIERPGDTDEHAYLSDFGITKNIASGHSLTATGQFVGTVDYIAPEPIEGHFPLDRRADVCSLGAMVFECVSGECPTRGTPTCRSCSPTSRTSRCRCAT